MLHRGVFLFAEASKPVDERYETAANGGFRLSGAKYNAAFRARVFDMIDNQGVRGFKFDGIGGGLFQTGPNPTYKFGDQWVVSDRLLLDAQYTHLGNNFILDFHEPGLKDVQPTLIISTGLNGRSGAQSVFLRPVNSVTLNGNYFLPGKMGSDHAFKFGGYWKDAYSQSLNHTGGYATGVFLGKHPLAPIVSKAKTWEGFAGSVIACSTAGILLLTLTFREQWWKGLLFGLALVVTATVGDLGESLVKRDLGIKDMGSLLPGHGGVMDRLDSLLPCAAVAYLLLSAFAPV